MRINYNDARFVASYGTSSQLPPSKNPEISFAGRSNVGKSSLLNKLMMRKSLAKVSSTPGKTATINFYTTGNIDFVDLPGYGYAKVAKSEKWRWSELIEGYFNQERNFACVCVLLDVRHEPSNLDARMVEFLCEARLPFALIFTKADKLSKQAAVHQANSIRASLGIADNSPSVLTSAVKGSGIDDLRKLIAQHTSA